MVKAVRFLACAALIFSLHTEAAPLDGRVAHVVDGDTLDVIVEGKRIRVRILDIDAPEQAQPYGHRSRQSLIAICGGESARIDGSKTDRTAACSRACNVTPSTQAPSKCAAVWPGYSCATRRSTRRCMLSSRKLERLAGLMGYASADCAVEVAPALTPRFLRLLRGRDFRWRSWSLCKCCFQRCRKGRIAAHQRLPISP